LSKLNKGLLFLFLELLTVLVQQSSAYSSAVTPVLVTLHNMIHLINMARHHQVGRGLLAGIAALYMNHGILHSSPCGMLAANVCLTCC
jgi:hypothetical protein